MFILNCSLNNQHYVTFHRGKISELLIRKSTEGDAGLYTCEAVNNLGKTNTTASLTISKSKNASFFLAFKSIMCKLVARPQKGQGDPDPPRVKTEDTNGNCKITTSVLYI